MAEYIQVLETLCSDDTRATCKILHFIFLQQLFKC